MDRGFGWAPSVFAMMVKGTKWPCTLSSIVKVYKGRMAGLNVNPGGLMIERLDRGT